MKEKELVKEILNIINQGGIITINLEKGVYVPVPTSKVEDCINFRKYDTMIQKEDLVKELQKKRNEMTICWVHKDTMVIAKRGTSIVVYQ